jgi:hypothetical protein
MNTTHLLECEVMPLLEEIYEHFPDEIPEERINFSER